MEENGEGKFKVIDGQQKLTAIKEFINNKFKLTGLDNLEEEYNKRKFKEFET